MPQIIADEFEEDFSDVVADARAYRAELREKLTAALSTIAAEATLALKDARLDIQVFFTIPTSGDALVTIATPIDPSDDDWERVSAIVRPIIASKIGVTELFGRNVPCASAGSLMGAANLVTDSTVLDG